jgi:hypothetical protein
LSLKVSILCLYSSFNFWRFFRDYWRLWIWTSAPNYPPSFADVYN